MKPHNEMIDQISQTNAGSNSGLRVNIPSSNAAQVMSPSVLSAHSTPLVSPTNAGYQSEGFVDVKDGLDQALAIQQRINSALSLSQNGKKDEAESKNESDLSYRLQAVTAQFQSEKELREKSEKDYNALQLKFTDESKLRKEAETRALAEQATSGILRQQVNDYQHAYNRDTGALRQQVASLQQDAHIKDQRIQALEYTFHHDHGY